MRLKSETAGTLSFAVGVTVAACAILVAGADTGGSTGTTGGTAFWVITGCISAAADIVGEGPDGPLICGDLVCDTGNIRRPLVGPAATVFCATGDDIGAGGAISARLDAAFSVSKIRVRATSFRKLPPVPRAGGAETA